MLESSLESGFVLADLYLRINYLRIESDRPLWWLSGKISACQCWRLLSQAWSQKIPLALKQLSLQAPTPESVLWSLGALSPEPSGCNCWSPCALESELDIKRSPCRERPTGHNWRGACAFSNQRKAHATVKTQHSQKITLFFLKSKDATLKEREKSNFVPKYMLPLQGHWKF